MLSFHSALCPDSNIAPPPLPSLQCLGVKYAGLKIFIHFIQTTAKKMLFLDQEWQAFFPWAISLVPENRESLRLMSNLPGQGMHVISLVRMSLMPFSLDPNIWVWHAAFITISLDLQITPFFPKPFFQCCRNIKYSTLLTVIEMDALIYEQIMSQ